MLLPGNFVRLVKKDLHKLLKNMMQITTEYHTTIFLPYQDKDDKIKKQESKKHMKYNRKTDPIPLHLPKNIKTYSWYKWVA